MHRPFQEYDSLDGAMCHKENRTLSKSLTLRYDKVLFILEPSDLARRLARRRLDAQKLRHCGLTKHSQIGIRGLCLT